LVKKKTSDFGIEVKRGLISEEASGISISRQCQLLDIPRSTYYYESYLDDAFNISIMHLIDEVYTENCFYGARRMSIELKKKGYAVGRDLASTLMKRMGIEAVYPKPKLSAACPEHKIYPYLLRGLKIIRKNQVWSTDITYIRMQNGFLYLVAIIDWFSRYVIAWKLSNSLDGLFCRETLQEALKRGKPDIFNTDQGAQFTCNDFVEILLANEISVSMDGRGRAIDNVFIERLWRSLKQENIYIMNYQNGLEVLNGLRKYFMFYNEKRPHMSLDYCTPAELYGT